MANLSIYTSANDTVSKETISFELLLDSIKNGKWEDQTHKIRVLTDEDERRRAKLKLPGVTIAGEFEKRQDDGLLKHSGYIAIDIDKIAKDEFSKLRNKLEADRYSRAVFTSVSGRGFCVIVKINPKKHREAFQGLGEYYRDNYGIIIDPTSINMSRVRFVSYDPNLYANSHSDKFEQYPKSKPPKRVERVVYVKSEFDRLINDLAHKRLNIAEDYSDWLRIGFGLAHQFNESGREYFHLISQHSSKYDSAIADKQYDACLKHKSSRSECTIATVYYYFKQAGLELYSKEFKATVNAVKQGKAAGLKPDQIQSNLSKFANIDFDLQEIESIAAQPSEAVDKEQNKIEFIEWYLKTNHNLKRNEITRYVEDNGKILYDEDINSIYVEIKRVNDKIPFELIQKYITSNNIASYNPFIDFFADYKESEVKHGLLDKMVSCIESDDFDYNFFFMKRWFLSIISAMHGEPSELKLTFAGPGNEGKTWYYRKILPKELDAYFANMPLTSNKTDIEILLAKKLIVLDDESQSKSRSDEREMKYLTTVDVFTVREPYGRTSRDLKRYGVFCGTSNEDGLLNDPTGNRREIIVRFLSYNWDLYNSVDKKELFYELYYMYKRGDAYKLNREDVAYLNSRQEQFEAVSEAKELILKYYEIPQSFNTSYVTTTDIKIRLEDMSKIKVSTKRISQEMKRLGFKQEILYRPSKKVWAVNEIFEQSNRKPLDTSVVDELPF